MWTGILRNNITHPGQITSTIWYLHDKAVPHFVLVLRDFVIETFPNSWIRPRGHIEWHGPQIYLPHELFHT